MDDAMDGYGTGWQVVNVVSNEVFAGKNRYVWNLEGSDLFDGGSWEWNIFRGVSQVEGLGPRTKKGQNPGNIVV